MEKTVYLLIGLKGSGKSYVGRLMERDLGVEFLNVEEFFMKLLSNPDDFNEEENVKVWQEVEDSIDLRLKNVDKISLESVGILKSFRDFLRRLELKYEVKLIQIKTPLDLCLERIKKRRKDKHVELSWENIEKMNRLFLLENYDFDLVINNKKFSDKKILRKIKNLFSDK